MADTIPSIIKPAYYTGQLLTVEDFNNEQNFQIQYRNFGTRELLSAGVLTGLMVNNNGSTIAVGSGAAIDSDGQYILLANDKSYSIVEADGDFQLIISYNMTVISGGNNQMINDPILQLVPANTTIGNGVLLANVAVVNKTVSRLDTVTSSVQLLSSRMPKQSVQNLDASVITTGVLSKDRIPNLQDLNGILTQDQLPVIPDKGNVVVQNSFTAGTITGLTVSAVDKTVHLTVGIGIDTKGNQILLNNEATYKNSTITLQNGIFSIDMSDADFQDKTFRLLISWNTADVESPLLQLIESTAPLPDGIVLATIKVSGGLPDVSLSGRQSMLLETARLPVITPGLLPDLIEMNGKVGVTQLPDLGVMEGKMNPGQLPELQDMRGQLTQEQLPPDIGTSKEYLTFFTNQVVVGAGSQILFSWKTNNGVDGLELSYFSETGITNLTTGTNELQLTSVNFPLIVSANTTFTLTAFIKGTIVDQKQLLITVFLLSELVIRMFKNKKSASDCILAVIKQFPSATALETAVAFANAGYNAADTTGALKVGYPNLTPVQVAAALAVAFGTKTAESMAKDDKSKGMDATATGLDIIQNFPGISVTDFAVALANAGYNAVATTTAVKAGYQNLTPIQVTSALADAYGRT